MPDFAVLYSLKCQSLLPFSDFQPADRLVARSAAYWRLH